ncbi:MAG: hypothetical protein QNL62_07605 [Gammaproteobacteria bacterium]|nr:hypothetical protein [Gammaproteobacteria bacterium]
MNMQEIQQITSQSSIASANNNNTEREPFWGKDGFTFGDVLDVFNPLHHLPVVAKYYREQSHDEACEGAKLVGGALFGGLLGGVSGVLASIANSAIRHETHQDMSEHLLAVADSSIHAIADGPINVKQFSEQQAKNIAGKTDKPELLTQNTDMNPFFYELLHDAPEESFYSVRAGRFLSELESTQVHRTQRGTNWGVV